MRQREWYEFDDPGEEGTVWRVDVTFLLSSWECIYGRGCRGIPNGNDFACGCCSFGAHFTDDDDRKRVAKAARRLRPDQWQFHDRRKKAIGKTKTKVMKGACAFLNRADFEGGTGCALHVAAVEAGESPLDWKPDVCWQLPVKLRDDGDGRWVIEEYSRAGFGPGGDDFAWWCTEAPEAFLGQRHVYQSMEPELRRLMGDSAYEAMARYLAGREPQLSIRHPAEQFVSITTNGRARVRS